MTTAKHTDKTILCIDDNESILHYEKMLLERAGYAVLAAASADQALRLATMCEIDAVLLDYEMPGMNGDEMALEIKRIRPELRIIMLSGTVVPRHVLTLVDAFIHKLDASHQLLPMIADMCIRTPPPRQGLDE
jgi:CheY-like chemotaxis protein